MHCKLDLQFPRKSCRSWYLAGILHSNHIRDCLYKSDDVRNRNGDDSSDKHDSCDMNISKLTVDNNSLWGNENRYKRSSKPSIHTNSVTWISVSNAYQLNLKFIYPLVSDSGWYQSWTFSSRWFFSMTSSSTKENNCDSGSRSSCSSESTGRNVHPLDRSFESTFAASTLHCSFWQHG